MDAECDIKLAASTETVALLGQGKLTLGGMGGSNWLVWAARLRRGCTLVRGRLQVFDDAGWRVT